MDGNTTHELMQHLIRRTDSGRRLVSIATLAGGGAIIMMSVVGLFVSWFSGRKTPEVVDIFSAVVGAIMLLMGKSGRSV